VVPEVPITLYDQVEKNVGFVVVDDDNARSIVVVAAAAFAVADNFFDY